jgi:SAM-dependent methyltransferase
VKRCLSCQQSFTADDWRCPHCAWAPARLGGHLAFAPRLAAKNDAYPDHVFAELAQETRLNYWRVARNRLFTWAMRRYFPGATSFLEIGSGTGVVLAAFREAFPALRLWGSEVYADGLAAVARRVDGATLFQVDARRLPFDGELDVIGAFDVLEHLDEDAAVLAEMHRAVKPGGGILLSVPQHPCLWSQRDEALHHKRRYTRRHLVSRVEEAGFTPLRVTSFVSLPFPLVAVAALANRRRRADYDPFKELKLPAALDAALDLALSCERRIIQSGLSLPFGGSLLVVAQGR